MYMQHLETMDRMVEYRVSSIEASMAAAQQQSIVFARFRVQIGRMLIHLGTLLENECRERVAPVESATRQRALLSKSGACAPSS